MWDGISDAGVLALVGLFGGLLLGMAARIGRFCTLGAIEDLLYQNSSVRFRMWILAIGVSTVFVFALSVIGQFDPTQSIYHQTSWSPLVSILGGLVFGYGMSLTGTCGFGALARVGGGDLRSFVIVLVMGIASYVALSGPLAGARVALIESTDLETDVISYPGLIHQVIGMPQAAVGIALGGVLVLVAVSSSEFFRNKSAMLWACVVSLAIVSGWYGTYWIANQGFASTAVMSHTFSAPLGETLLFIMTSSGGGLSFGVGSVFGVLAGAFFGSVIKGHFRWEACEDPRELKRQILGAVCMGFGAVFALGCTVGQGISAFSVLALSAPVTFAAIFVGAAIGLRQLITGFANP